MNSRLSLATTALACLILFAAIAFVFTLVIMTLVTGEAVDFVGGHQIPDAATARAAMVLAA